MVSWLLCTPDRAVTVSGAGWGHCIEPNSHGASLQPGA